MRSDPLGHLIVVVISEEAFDKQMRKMHFSRFGKLGLHSIAAFPLLGQCFKLSGRGLKGYEPLFHKRNRTHIAYFQSCLFVFIWEFICNMAWVAEEAYYDIFWHGLRGTKVSRRDMTDKICY